MAEDLYKASASSDKKLVSIEGGNHNDLPYFGNYATSIEEFIFN